MGHCVNELGDDLPIVSGEGKAGRGPTAVRAAGRPHAKEGTSRPANASAPATGPCSAAGTPRGIGVVSIYTDGGCVGNPGPGGFGAVIIDGEQRQEVQGGYRHTTNNRMEIMAAIAALAALSGRRTVTVFTDSQYLANAMNRGWAKRWRAKGWMRSATDRALNPDLWERLLALADQHDVRFRWVPGHAGHPDNERAHALSVQAARGKRLPVDTGYAAG